MIILQKVKSNVLKFGLVLSSNKWWKKAHLKIVYNILIGTDSNRREIV